MSITNCIGELKHLQQTPNLELKTQIYQIINSPRLLENLTSLITNNLKLKKSLDSIGVSGFDLASEIQQTICSSSQQLYFKKDDNLDNLYNQVRKSINVNVKSYLKRYTENEILIGKIQGFLGECIKDSIKKTAPELGLTRGRVNTPEIGKRLIQTEGQLGYLTSTERATYLSQTRNVNQDLIASHAERTNKLELKNLDPKLKKFAKEIETEVKKSILRVLITYKNLSPIELREYAEVITQIWTDIYSNQKVNLWYLRNTDVINQKIVEALGQNRLSLDIVTCPDYSGFYDENGVFHFDFKGFGSGDRGQITGGVVTAKSFDLVEGVLKATSKHVPTEVHHSLPTWEFPEKGKPSMNLSKEASTIALQYQLTKIQAEYKVRNINAQTKLSGDLIMSDQSFWDQKQVLTNHLRDLASSNNPQTKKEILALLQNTAKQRLNLYQKWFPQYSNESSEQYQNRIMYQIVPESLAEYLAIGLEYRDNRRGAIILDSSSRVTCGVYEQFKCPAIHGYSRNANRGYEGD